VVKHITDVEIFYDGTFYHGVPLALVDPHNDDMLMGHYVEIRQALALTT
jgi:hypothetical protein